MDYECTKEMRLKHIKPKLKMQVDSTEPKSIQEIKDKDVNIYNAAKGKDSIVNGIVIVLRVISLT